MFKAFYDYLRVVKKMLASFSFACSGSSRFRHTVVSHAFLAHPMSLEHPAHLPYVSCQLPYSVLACQAQPLLFSIGTATLARYVGIWTGFLLFVQELTVVCSMAES